MSPSPQGSKELEVLVEVTEILTSSLPFPERCDSVLAVLAEFTGSDIVTLRELDSEAPILSLVASYSRLPSTQEIREFLPAGTYLSGQSLETGQPAAVNDYSAKVPSPSGYIAGIRSALSLPIQLNGELFGTLGFGSTSTGHYQEDTVRALSSFAAAVGMMMAKAQLEKIHEIEASVGRIVSAPLVGLDVFEQFAEQAAKALDFDRFVLNSVDVDNGTFVTEFIFGEEAEGYPVGKVLSSEGTAQDLVIRSRAGQRGALDELDDGEPRFPNSGFFVDSGQRYFLGVPLIVGNQLVGTIGFNRGSGPFTRKDLLRAERLGVLVAGAFADYKQQEFRAQAEREINRNRTILEVEAAIGRVLTSPLENSELFEEMRQELNKMLPVDRLVIASVDLDTQTFNQEFSEFFNNPDMMAVDNTGQPYFGSITGEVIKTGVSQIFHSDDTRIVSGDLPRAKAVIEQGYTSMLATPLGYEGKIIGTIICGRRDGKYGDEDMVAVERIGTLVAGALATFRIAKERDRAQSAREESERRNTIILEVEANIGRILSSSLSSPGSAQSLMLELAEIIPLDRYVILSTDLETETFTQDFHSFLYDPALILANNQGQTYVGSLTGEIIRTGVGQTIHSDDPRLSTGELPLAQMVFRQGYRSLMGVPLRYEGRIIGVFACSRSVGEYDENDVNIANRIGTILAGALATFKIIDERDRAQSARVESEMRYTAILEVEAEIGRILSSPIGIADVFDRFAMEIRKLISFDRVTITGVDLEDKVFTQDFLHLTGDERYNLGGGRSYEGTVVGAAVESSETVIISAGDDRLQTPEFDKVPPHLENGQTTFMAVPLVSQDQMIGALAFSRSGEHYTKDDQDHAERLGALIAGPMAGHVFEQARLRAEESQKESEALLGQIADSIGGVFWLVDLDPHRLVYASPRAEEVWGLPLSEIYDDFSYIFSNIHPEDREEIRNDSAVADKSGYLDIEYRIFKEDGEVRWIRSRGFPVRDNGQDFSRMSGFAEDVTDRKAELERITEAGRLLSVGELASGVAHEINNPLAAINLYSEALMDQPLPDDVKEDLKVISAQGKRAGNIVRNLLQFARNSSPEVTSVDAKEFIDRCVALKSHDFRVNNVSATTKAILDTPSIEIDEQLMTQVILNILSNAEQACVKAHGRGHITILVQETGSSIRISISDDGPGISEEILPKVFDPFFTTKEVGFGTGLGLSVSYGIIAQLGGSLWVESDGKSGADFHIEIPAMRTEESPETADPLGPASESASQPRILVVDDERDLRNILERILIRLDYAVDQASDGEEAWGKLQQAEYDCILLDMRMPGTGGQELFERLSASDPGTSSKVIFLTGDLANDNTRRFLGPLDNLALAKPVSIEDLEEALGLFTRRVAG